MKTSALLRLLATGGLALAILACLTFLPVQEWILDAIAALRRTGPWAPWILIALYAVTGVVAVPSSFLSLAAGFVFGFFPGAPVAWSGTLLGATGAYFAGRGLARGGVARWLERKPRFRALDRALGRHGMRVVLLLRLSPVFPANLLNYLFGLSRIAPGKFLVGTALGGAPVTLLYVYFGAAARRLTDRFAQHLAAPSESQWALLLLGLVATTLAVTVISRIARQALDEAVAEEEEDATSEPSTNV